MERGHTEDDRRSGEDRRAGQERRSVKKPLATDFRSGEERRTGADRRNVEALRAILGGRILADGPIDTPVTYSRDEAAKIRAQVEKAVDPVLCPRCDGPLKAGPRITRRDGAIQELVCDACRRCMMVKSKAD